jgi:hypothetical protein
MEIQLAVGRIYQLYTKFESIAGEPVTVVGTIAYSEVGRIPYNVTVLAINERVIAVKEENLQERIKGDTIYHCRSLYAKPDGTYSEYIVWDSIVNFEKTIRINETYKYELDLSLTDVLNSPITQVISDIERYVAKMYPTLHFSILSVTDEETVASGTGTGEITEKEDKYAKAEAIIDRLNKLENKLVPAAEAIISSELVSKVNQIIDGVDTINNNVQIIANNSY